MSNEVQGRCDPRFLRLKEIFEDNFARGLETGASLAVTVDGELVVDLWGGHADAQQTRPWNRDTVVLVFSSTKIPVALCAHMLIDQDRLDLDVPIAHYWPAFGAKGKDKVLVRHIFDHSSAVPGYDPPIPFATQYDWSAITAALAGQPLWWKPGTANGYHGSTFGVLLGELVRRISGKTVGQFLKSEVTQKIGADFQIGFDMNDFPRMATIVETDLEEWGPPGSMAYKAQNSFVPPLWQGTQCLTSEMPSANGIGNARSLAQIGAIYAMNGVLNGQRFLNPGTVDRVLAELSYRRDMIVDMPVRWGLGLGLNSAEFECPGEGSLHWGGAGGSLMVADRDYRVSIGYAMNRMYPSFIDDPRTTPLRVAFNEIVRAMSR